MQKTSDTRYSKEFRESMISLHQTGRPANSLSKEYNVSVSTLTKWIRQADPNDRNVLSIKERELFKENKQLKEQDEELLILKKPQPYSLERPKFTCSIYRKMV